MNKKLVNSKRATFSLSLEIMNLLLTSRGISGSALGTLGCLGYLAAPPFVLGVGTSSWTAGVSSFISTSSWALLEEVNFGTAGDSDLFVGDLDFSGAALALKKDEREF